MLLFVYLPLAEGVLDDEEWRAVEQTILANPRVGPVVQGTGGIRKLRAGMQGRGKRGGAQVLYLYVEQHQRVYLLLAYAKNVQEDVSAEQRERLRILADTLKRRI